MLADAVVYQTLASLRNRLRMQLKRARSPRTIVALAAGGFYMWWFLVRPANRGGAAALLGDAWVPRLAALAITVLAVRWWLAGADARALAFTPAELHLLFPAPVTRRGLVAYKLLKAQLTILANTVIWTVLLRGEGTELASWRRALAVWLLFSVLYLHRLGASLVTAPPPSDARAAHGWRLALRRGGPPVALAALAMAVLAPLAAASPILSAAWNRGFSPFLRAFGAALEAPSASLALLPARATLAPVFSADAGAWLLALGPALVVLAAHFGWVLRGDSARHETALVATERRVRQMARRRGGSLVVARDRAPVGDTAPAPRTARRWSPRLSPVGPAELAIVWKNGIAALRANALTRVLALYGTIAAGLLAASVRDARLAELVTVLVGVWLVLLLVAGPLWIRFDLRLDLPHLAVLRAWPLAGREVVRAEIAASTLALTTAQVGIQPLLFVASALVTHSPLVRHALGAGRVAAAVLGLPGMNVASLTVQNGAALLFPTWVRPTGGPRGIEAMGQGLLTTGVALTIAATLLALPAAAAGGLAWALRPALGVWALVPAAALLSVGTLLEMRPLHAWLGRVFERTDPGALGAAR
jgi:hypothetical protein